MSYRRFTVEEFVLDKYFRQWFKGKSLEYVLKAVAYTMDFNFTIEKKKVKINL